MLQHPGTELQVLIKEKGLTQKAFSSILGKKVSEVNELLKGKRNITIQRDYLLHQTLGTPIKYWILKQIDYDYSLLDIEESDTSSFGTQGRILSDNEQNTQDSSSQTPQNDNMTQISHSERSEESIDANPSSGASAKDLKGEAEELNTQNSSSSLHSSSEGQKENKDDEDHRNRAKIFRSF